MLKKEWFSAAELAAEGLPGLPRTESGMLRTAKELRWRSIDAEGDFWRQRPGRGGGTEYRYSILPPQALAEIVKRYATDAAATPAPQARAFETFTRASDKKKARAEANLRAMREAELLTPSLGAHAAKLQAAQNAGISVSKLYGLFGRCGGLSSENRIAALVPMHHGRTVRAACSEDAWRFLTALYLRQDEPTFEACWRELEPLAKKEGWSVPSGHTLRRRLETDVPEPVRVLYRKGPDALKRLYPYQERDRSMFHALEAVNADGHTWDMKVRWPDGDICRPSMVAFQDLYSNLIVGWRVDKSENKEMVRLAYADVVQRYGIPEHCWLDNGRAFASKWLTGGIKNRFRFTIREEDPHGVLPLLGTEVHWTLPYSGQSKPIERAFGEFAGNYAKHPKFHGAGTGNKVTNKPANYGDAVIDLKDFLEVAAEQIAEHNSRPARRTPVCGGRLSFQEAFNASYAAASIRKASAHHLQVLLLAAEGVTVSARDGSFKLQENRYWSEDLLRYRGQPITVRFDPQALTEEVFAYAMDGTLICRAALQGIAKFNDAEAARAHAQARNAWLKSQKDMGKALVKMSVAEAAALTRQVEPPPPPESKVVRPVFGNLAVQARPVESAEERQDVVMDHFMRAMNAQRAERERLRIVPEQETDADG